MRKIFLVFSFFFFLSSFVIAQGIKDDYPLQLKRVVILTSGLAYFEYSGSVNGNAEIAIPFRRNAMSDALKTLVVNDPASQNPVVTYQLSNSFTETTQIAVNTENGMMIYPVEFIKSVKFTDPAIQEQVDKALNELSESKNSSRLLTLNLPGSGARAVSISYVIPSPVWKVSYRLDLGQSRPVFQGWAIVDNDSDTDWKDVDLSLVSGRPVSFIQNFYPPYFVVRPVLPLSIAGTASAQAHDRGASMNSPSPSADTSALYAEKEEADYGYFQDQSIAEADMRSRTTVLGNAASGSVQTAQGHDAGGQFEFTIRNPVTINGNTSAMFPLVESQIEARKILFYNGHDNSRGRYPRLGAEITNNSGMKLPAGPITVYDGGVYAGDALIDFWNEDEKRIISFGEDLTVSASMASATANTISTVTISKGVMTISRNITYSANYTFINSSPNSKQMVVEKNIIANTNLISPEASEKTNSAYRFNVTLQANRETVFTVNEQRPVSESITLLSQRNDSLLSYSTNHEIPQRVRAALQRAFELKKAAEDANNNAREIETQRSRLVSEQERIRQNLQAVGNQTPQGASYLNRLASLDGEIDALTANLNQANTNAKNAQAAYENYINGLSL